MQNFDGHNAIINTLAVNEANVLFSGGNAHPTPASNIFLTLRLTGDNGSMHFWDWKSGHRFQSLDTTAQPGSLDAESGIMYSTFDRTGARLITAEADKTSKPA